MSTFPHIKYPVKSISLKEGRGGGRKASGNKTDSTPVACYAVPSSVMGPKTRRGRETRAVPMKDEAENQEQGGERASTRHFGPISEKPALFLCTCCFIF